MGVAAEVKLSTTTTTTLPPSSPQSSAGRHEVLSAARNAFKLGGSLAFTWTIALAVRLLLPRLLGPELFGPLSFADSFTTLFFVTLGLGVEVYIRKEVSLRPAHASDFFGAIVLLQVLLSVALVAVMAIVLHAGGRPAAVREAVYVFAGAQLLVSVNNSLAATLHARGEVDGLSVVNIATKALWGAAVFAAVLGGRPRLPAIAGALLVSELLKAGALGYLARKHVGLQLRVDLRAAKAVILASLPFYLSAVACTAYAKLDQSVLAFITDSDVEVGWYAAAMGIAGLSMLISPIMGWVLMPLFARARARSQEEFEAVVRRSLELILVIALAVALGMSVGADLWVKTMFGPAFAPATRSLQILAPMFVLTYFASLMGTVLILQNRGWTMMAISTAGLALNFALNLLLVRPCLAWFGTGGGGIGCSVSQVITETGIATMMLVATRARMIDRRLVVTLARGLLVCAIVSALHLAMRPLGPVRVAIDAALCIALLLGLRAVRATEILAFVRMARARRPAAAPQAPTPPSPAAVAPAAAPQADSVA